VPTGFHPVRDLDAKVAALVAPKVEQVAKRVARRAKSPGYAPPTKAWVSVGDERVRPEHRTTERDNPSVPANLRFKVTTNRWEVEHRGRPERQLAHAPRDPALSVGTRINCRCKSVQDVEGIRRTIEALPAQVHGSTVAAAVRCTHPRAAGAEYGEGSDRGTRFLGRAVRDEAARMRG
jgi:hypothetical protein